MALQFAALGSMSVAFNAFADVAVAFAAGGFREGAAARPALVRRLWEAPGAAMVAPGRRPRAGEAPCRVTAELHCFHDRPTSAFRLLGCFGAVGSGSHRQAANPE